MRAAEIGYAIQCHRDHADCQGFSPRIVLNRSKTLMQGDDCCNHRFVWQG
ncbi:MAG: L-2-amino-thiazoline-4-carboxylic acid hydrolase [Anaerolineae bacterium]